MMRSITLQTQHVEEKRQPTVRRNNFLTHLEAWDINHRQEDITFSLSRSSERTIPNEQRRSKSSKKESIARENSHQVRIRKNVCSHLPIRDTYEIRRIHVTFGSVTILEFPQILGDHPCVSSGAPITLDWNCRRTRQMDVQTFEDSYRSICPRRSRRELALTGPERFERLLKAGYSLDDIAQATLEAQRVQTERTETAQSFKKGRRYGRFLDFTDTGLRKVNGR